MLRGVVDHAVLSTSSRRDKGTRLRLLRDEVSGKLGSYELLHRIGSGGMGEVFLACDTTIGGSRTPVALKRVLPGLGNRVDVTQLFLDEARLTTRMTHRNLVPAMDIACSRSHGFFTMPFVDGIPLTTLLRTAARSGHGVPEGVALGIVQSIATGLHYAHELAGVNGQALGVVHCDVSPSNVLVSRAGEVKIVDFGIARGHHVMRSVPEMAFGTLGYASPEQTRGGRVDRRGDVFSLGVLLWELSTMRRLFRGVNRADTAIRVTNADVPRPSSVRAGYSAELEDIVMRALRRDRNERLPSALRLEIALERYGRRHNVATNRQVIGHWVRRVLAPQRKRSA